MSSRRRSRSRSRERSGRDKADADRPREKGDRDDHTKAREESTAAAASAGSKRKRNDSDTDAGGRKARRSSRSRSRSDSRSRSPKSSKSKKPKKAKAKKSKSKSKSKSKKSKAKKSKRSDTDSDSGDSSAGSGSGSDSGSDSGTDNAAAAAAAEKARRKSTETEEERRARRIAKKLKKQSARDAAEKVHGYTNDSNPFGDQNLGAAFVWKKKLEVDLAKGKDPRALKAEYHKQREEAKGKIEEVKRRREQREVEKAQMEEMKAQMQRDMDMEQVEGWERKEEEFHLAQSKLRSAIRIREGREKAIDILAKNLVFDRDPNAPPPTNSLHPHAQDANLPVDLDVELTEPYKLFEGLTVSELNELKADLLTHVALGAHLPYWQALVVVCDDEIVKLQAQQPQVPSAKPASSSSSSSSSSSAAALTDAARKRVTATNPYGLPSAIEKDVVKLFAGKTVVQLESLEVDIKKRASGQDTGGEVIDTEYWSSLLKQLTIYRARAFLREFHAELLKKRLKQLKDQLTAQQAAAAQNGGADADYELPLEQDDGAAGADADGSGSGSGGVAAATAAGADDGSFSPVLLQDADLAEEAAAASAELGGAVSAEDDARELERQRKAVLEAKAKEAAAEAKHASGSAAGPSAADGGLSEAELRVQRANQAHADAVFRKLQSDGAEGDDVAFKAEVSAAPSTPYWWHDKYRPRKPRFFNRVKTGFEWNKYNQTHYDKENPPPKIVQGYKFNVFYPDLINPSEPPRYKIEPDPSGSTDYCIIRFTAGPPYEDIAFKIVKKEWEYSHKRGFRCVFDRGVLSLFFNFRRFFYRR